MCLDYRHVNKHLATDIYPLPRLEELVDQAASHNFYATLDMREAYFQIPGWSGKIWAFFPIPSRPCSPSSE